VSGEEQIQRDIAEAGRFARLAALLDHSAAHWPAGVVPPLGHWLCFLPNARQSDLGPDGHPRRTDAFPRRMWAGSRVRFLAPIPLGAAIERRTTMLSTEDKHGRSGAMRFVTLEHRISVEGAPAVIEEQDLVYRAAAEPGVIAERPAIDPGAPDATTRAIVIDPVALFRFSALTFNAHRIHYDRDYARDGEGYAGLVVHGPLVATLLMDLMLRARPGFAPKAFEFRARSPLFDGENITLGMTGNVLRAVGPAGVAVTASVQ
jgi:3-methylfumaryl-CoA hydratase